MSKKKPAAAPKEENGPGYIAPEADAKSGKKKGGKKLLFIALGLVLLLGGGGFAVFSGIIKLPFLSHPKSVAKVQQPQFVKIPELIANLDAGPGSDSYARMQAELEVPDAISAAAVVTQMPAIIDMFQSYLRTMQPDDLRGAEGLYRLREALLARANVVVAPSSVQDVLFIEMIVQ